MRVLLAHNDYGSFSGEEAAVGNVAAALQMYGHEVAWLRRSSAQIGSSVRRKAGAFVSGIYSIGARREMERLLDGQRFDIVQVQNLYPRLSRSCNTIFYLTKAGYGLGANDNSPGSVRT